MEEKGFFLIFAGLIIGLFIMGVNASNPGDTATSTAVTSETSSQNVSVLGGAAQDSRTETTQAPRYGSSNTTLRSAPVRTMTDREIQAELEDLYDEAWELEQKVDSFVRTQPESRYKDLVRLSRSGATSENPDREYLTVTLDRDASPTNISDWYVESYVTEERVALPDGTKVYVDGGTINDTEPIVLEPGQRAFLITGESPVGVSFQENSCIGYLTESERFYPGLTRSCPAPMDLMERYGNIELDDDSCYEFVRRVGRCRMIEDDDDRLDALSGRCERFVTEFLNYNSCVEFFSWRTDFHDPGDWYIYFERDEEKWRRQREIIRLMDQFDRVIAVLEY